MDFITHQGTTYEFTTTSPAGTDDWMVECTELTNPDGFVGVIRVSPFDELNVVEFHRGGVPTAVLRHWLSLLPDPMPKSG